MYVVVSMWSALAHTCPSSCCLLGSRMVVMASRRASPAGALAAIDRPNVRTESEARVSQAGPATTVTSETDPGRVSFRFVRVYPIVIARSFISFLTKTVKRKESPRP